MPVLDDRRRSQAEMNSHDASTSGEPVAIAWVWAYVVPIVVFASGAIWLSRLDHGSREQVLVSAIYVLVPLSVALGLLGGYAAHLGFMLIATAFCSGLLYCGDTGGGWSHGVAGGMTAANAFVAGLVLAATCFIRDRVLQWNTTANRTQNGGEQ